MSPEADFNDAESLKQAMRADLEQDYRGRALRFYLEADDEAEGATASLNYIRSQLDRCSPDQAVGYCLVAESVWGALPEARRAEFLIGIVESASAAHPYLMHWLRDVVAGLSGPWRVQILVAAVLGSEGNEAMASLDALSRGCDGAALRQALERIVREAEDGAIKAAARARLVAL